MRKVLITGATSGFGKLLVENFLKNGDTVFATGRDLKNRQDALSSYRQSYPGKLFEYSLDVTNNSEIEALGNAINKEHGGLDILINNAGHGLFGSLEDLSEQEIRHQMEVNFFGLVKVTQTLLPLLRKSKGMIFNFSSVFGFMGFPLTSIYCASKFAVEGLTESLRGELAPHGVKVCLIEPGGYRTNFGNSLAWASPASDSPYQKQTTNYRALRLKLSEKKNPQNPAEVAQGILKLSLSGKLPMRKVFGKDGRASYMMRRFLPSGIYWSILDKAFQKFFLKG